MVQIKKRVFKNEKRNNNNLYWNYNLSNFIYIFNYKGVFLIVRKTRKMKHKSKVQIMWEVSREQEELFKKEIPLIVKDIDVKELFKLIRGTEYRRGKEDALLEKQKNNLINPFTEKCICDWSKDDEFGFMANTKCLVHGKDARKFLKGCVEIDVDALESKKEKSK